MFRGGLRLHLCFSIQSLRFDVSLSALAGGMFVNRLQRVLGKGGKVRRHCSRKELAKEWRKARKERGLYLAEWIWVTEGGEA